MSEEVTTEATAEATTETQEAPSLLEAFKPHVPEDKQAWFGNFKDDAGLKNTIFSLVEMAGKKGDIPAEDASPEKLAEFWGKLGASNVKPGEYQYGEEFGDLAPALSEQHGQIDQKITELFNAAVKDSRSLPEIKEKVLKGYLASEAEAMKQEAVKAESEAKERFHKMAVEYGLSEEQLNGTLKGVFSRLGLKDDVPQEEALIRMAHAFAKATTDTKTLESAHLHNTNEGLDMQIQEISLSDEYLCQTGPKHDAAVEKLTSLLTKKEKLQNNS